MMLWFRAVVDLTEKVARGGQLLPRPDIDRPLTGLLQMNAAAEVKAADLLSGPFHK